MDLHGIYPHPLQRFGRPCPHQGCQSHVSHPCEGCGRINGIYATAAADLYSALEEVLNTGLNGGNDMRLAMLSAKRMELAPEELAQAEASEQAVKRARVALAKARGESK